MALTLSQIVKGKKSLKEKAEIAQSFWILDIFLSLKDGEWTISAEMLNQGHGYVLPEAAEGKIKEEATWHNYHWVCAKIYPIFVASKLRKLRVFSWDRVLFNL